MKEKFPNSINIVLLLYHCYAFIKYLYSSFWYCVNLFFVSSSVPLKLLYPIAESFPSKFLLSFILSSDFFKSLGRRQLSAEFNLANSYINSPLDYLDKLLISRVFNQRKLQTFLSLVSITKILAIFLT